MDHALAAFAEKIRKAARAARDRQDDEEAERLALEAAETSAAAGDERGRTLAITLAGSAQFRQGRLADAEASFRSIIDYEPELGRTLNNLARVVGRRGRPHEALDLFDRALIALQEGSPEHRAIALDNIGVQFSDLGLLDEAWTAYELAADQLAGIDSDVAWATRLHVLNNKGVIRRRQGLLDAAERLYQETLALARERGDQRTEASAEQNLGIVAARRGQHDEARSRYRRAYDLRSGYGDDAEAAQSLHSLGRVELRTGDFAAATAHFERAHELRRRVGDPKPLIDTLLDWGRALARLGRIEEARERYAEGQRVIEETRAGIESDELRQAFLATVADLYSELAVLLLSEGDTEGGFATSEHGRARVLRERVGASTPARVAEHRGRAALEEERAALKQLAALYEAERERELEIGEHERKLALRRKLLRTRGGAVPALDFAPASLDEVAHRLPADTQLLSFIVGEERSFALVLSRDDRSVHEVPGRAEMEVAATAFRAALLSRQYDRDAALLLRRSLLDLASPRARRLLIVPDGPLHDVPWAALPDDEGGFIVGRHAVSVAPAASTVLVERAPPAFRARLIAFAAPAESARHDLSDAGVPRVRARVRPIPQTVREVETIAGLFTDTGAGDLPVVVRTRERATIAELLAVIEREGPPQYLHLACHGLVHPDRPDLSGVALTAPDRVGVEVWRAPEIVHTGLRCELATLSACDTATGPNVPGEGVISLGYALLAAGARHACVALWPVIDDAAPELMQHFYSALRAGFAPDLALAQAQRETAQRRWRHPFYWAWPLLVQF